ncbi:response regulator [uncultured Algimonas sp.]|uniref:response regulator n=1 Tax=uncultured Algimonas sp. TaxID=1547920 RepID=UPI00262FB006|nr:response regulator [uncultured Algimonas sp.]
MDKVLIVDDSEFDRKMIKKAITSKRSDIAFAELQTGQSVSDIILQEEPRLAILDIRMPGMDGFQVLDMIRADPKTAGLPVLMISGSEQPEDRAISTAKGADGYYVKPPSAAAYFNLGREIYEQYLCCSI